VYVSGGVAKQTGAGFASPLPPRSLPPPLCPPSLRDMDMPSQHLLRYGSTSFPHGMLDRNFKGIFLTAESDFRNY